MLDEDFEETWDMGPPSNPPDLREKSRNKVVELAVQWFLDNFEDPVHRTPRDEGEYIFIWGGPYDTRDELTAAFGDAITEQALNAAVNKIEEDGFEWVPSGNRMCRVS